MEQVQRFNYQFIRGINKGNCAAFIIYVAFYQRYTPISRLFVSNYQSLNKTVAKIKWAVKHNWWHEHVLSYKHVRARLQIYLYLY